MWILTMEVTWPPQRMAFSERAISLLLCKNSSASGLWKYYTTCAFFQGGHVAKILEVGSSHGGSLSTASEDGNLGKGYKPPGLLLRQCKNSSTSGLWKYTTCAFFQGELVDKILEVGSCHGGSLSLSTVVFQRWFTHSLSCPNHTKLPVRFQPWNCWGLCSKLDVGPLLFTLLQSEMLTDGAWSGWCYLCDLSIYYTQYWI